MRYFESKDYRFSLIANTAHPQLSPDQREEVNDHWQRLSLANSHLFNGPILCCHDLRVRHDTHPSTVEIYVNPSDYATYSWARKNNIVIPGTHTMGTATFIYSLNHDAWMFTRRSSNVIVAPLKISATSGGVIEPPGDLNSPNILDHVHFQAKKETAEEVNTVRHIPHSFLGGYFDENTHKFEFAYSGIAGNVSLVRNFENFDLLAVHPGDVRSQLFSGNLGKLETSTKNHLERWADRMDQGPLYI